MSARTFALLTDASVTVGASSTTALEANSVRNFLMIQNTHAANSVGVNLSGGTAAINAAGSITLAAGSAPMTFSQGVPVNKITVIGSGVGTTVTIYWA